MTIKNNKNHEIIEFIRAELKRQKKTVPEICDELNISKSVIYNWSFNGVKILEVLDQVLDRLGYRLQIQKKEAEKTNHLPKVHFLK